MAVIGTIRRKLGGILVVLIALAMVGFIMMDFGGTGGNRGPVNQNGVAVVDGVPVSYDEFNERLELNESYRTNQTQQALTEVEKENVRKSTFNELIGEKLKANLFQTLGLTVTDAEKKAMLYDKDFVHPSLKSNFKTPAGDYDLAMFKQYIENLNLDDGNMSGAEKVKQWNNFEKAIFKERANNKYNTLLSKSVKVPTWMATELYNKDKSTANIEYVFVPFSSVQDDAVSFTDNDLQTYLDKHINEYKQNASVSVKYVPFPIQPSTADIDAVQTWMNEKFTAWQDAAADSLFVMANSETRWDGKYYGKDELANIYADSIFAASEGSFFGPTKYLDQFVAYKLIDKKEIPDSVQVRHLLITGEGYTSQEQLLARIDSLKQLIIEDGISLASLTAQFSQDPSNAQNGGDLGWVRPSEMVVPFNDAIFYEMGQGDVKMVYTQFGAHFVEVYNWGTTHTGVKLATLSKTIYPSEETNNNIYAEASTFANENSSKDVFVANTDKIKEAKSISDKASTMPGVDGNARQLVKWAFGANVGDVSSPFLVGENYVVALLTAKFEEGSAELESVRALVEEEVRKMKKAELIAQKMNGTDLNAIAANNSVSTGVASNLSFTTNAIPGVGNEPKVAAAALMTAQNTVSKPIVGESGVFVIKPTSVNQAAAPTDLSSFSSNAFMYNNRIAARLIQALKENADFEDYSLEYF